MKRSFALEYVCGDGLHRTNATITARYTTQVKGHIQSEADGWWRLTDSSTHTFVHTLTGRRVGQGEKQQRGCVFKCECAER